MYHGVIFFHVSSPFRLCTPWRPGPRLNEFGLYPLAQHKTLRKLSLKASVWVACWRHCISLSALKAAPLSFPLPSTPAPTQDESSCSRILVVSRRIWSLMIHAHVCLFKCLYFESEWSLLFFVHLDCPLFLFVSLSSVQQYWFPFNGIKTTLRSFLRIEVLSWCSGEATPPSDWSSGWGVRGAQGLSCPPRG